MFREKLRIRLMFFEKILRNWPKRPIGIVVWVEGEIRGYGVVSKHSKRVPACGFCAVQVPCPNSQIACWGAGLRWRPQSVKRLQPVKEPQLSESESWGSLTGCAKNSTRRGAVFGLPKSMSLRASPRREASALGVQTGAAIRPTCGQAAIPVCRLIRLFAGTAWCRSPAPSSPPWWPRSG